MSGRDVEERDSKPGQGVRVAALVVAALIVWFAVANFQDIETRTLLNLIAGQSGKNIFVTDSVKGSVTLRVDRVPWDHVLDLVLQLQGLDKRVQDNVIIVGPTEELANREKVKGPRIVRYLNRRVGRARNHLALWVTALAYPIFWGIRFGEVVVYPMLVWTVRLPRYRQAEWVNVSRTKFDGLIGHDLIWCLYCDWMTGVYSLGAEMLRNVESFWCPIRFYDGKKCENCKVDFPDIDGGWAPAGGTMKDVVATMEEHYDRGDHSWFGHPRRSAEKVVITVEGKPTDAPKA